MTVYVRCMIVCVAMALPLVFVMVHDRIRPDKEIQLSGFTGMITIVSFVVSMALIVLLSIVAVSDRIAVRNYYRDKQRLECVTDGYEQAIHEAIVINERMRELMFVDRDEREHILSNPIDVETMRFREYESFRSER